MKNIISKFIFILFISLSFFSINAEEIIIDEINYEEEVTIKEATEDLTYRMIYSIFGYDILKLVSPYKKIVNDEGINKLEISAPFPYVADSFILIISIIAILSFIMALVYSMYLFYEMINRSQKSGEFLGKSWSANFFIIKSVLVAILLFPLNFNGYIFNFAQIIPLKVFAESNKHASKVINTFIEVQPKIYPEINYPKISYNLSHIGADFINFFNCLKTNELDYYQQTVAISENYIAFGLSSVSCEATIRFSLDSSTKNMINNNKNISEFITQKYSAKTIYLQDVPEITPYHIYKSNLAETYNMLFEKIINKAKIASDFMMVKNLQVNYRSPEEDRENSQLKEFIKHGNNNQYWENKCDILFDKSPILSGISNYDRLLFGEYASMCISYFITDSLVYPFDHPNIIKYLETDNYLKFNNLNLCSHDYESSGDILNFVENKNAFTNIKTINLNSCLEKECSMLGKLKSNAYNCSSVIKFNSLYTKDKQLAKLGVFAMGAIVQNSFNVYDNFEAKEIYNKIGKISIKKLNSTDMRIIDSLSLRKNYSHNIPNDSFKINARTLKSVDFGGALSQNILSYGNGTELLSLEEEITNIDSYFKNDFILERLIICTQNPLTIKNGYICGNIIQEYNRFGKELIKIYVYTEIARIIVNELYGGGKMAYSRLSRHKENKTENTKISDNPIKAVNNYLIKKAFVLFGAMAVPQSASINASFDGLEESAEEFIQDNLSLDNFGLSYNYMRGINYGSINLESMGIFGVVTVYIISDVASNQSKQFENNIFKSFLKSIMTFLLLIGILFAIIIPLIPYWLFLIVCINLIVVLISKIFTTALLIVFIMEPSQDNRSESLKRFFGEMMELLFKLPMIVIGLILSWVITNSVISSVFSMLNITDIFNLKSNETIMLFNYIIQFCYILISIVVYSILFFILTNATFNIIESFYSFSTSWIKGTTENIGLQNDRTQGVYGQFKNYYKQVGNAKRGR